MEHYICTGECKGMSNAEGVCNALDCSKYNHPLIKCECNDGKHVTILQKCEKCGELCGGMCDKK